MAPVARAGHPEPSYCGRLISGAQRYQMSGEGWVLSFDAGGLNGRCSNHRPFDGPRTLGSCTAVTGHLAVLGESRAHERLLALSLAGRTRPVAAVRQRKAKA